MVSMKTPLPKRNAVNGSAVAKKLVKSLRGNAPNHPKPAPATKNFDKMKDDKGSTTPQDKIATLTHLLDSVDFNMNHGYNHVMEAKVHAEKAIQHVKQNPQLGTTYKSLHSRLTKVNNKLKRFQPKD